MRIILLLAAAGAAAMAADAPARSFGVMGKSGGAPGASGSGAGHHAGAGSYGHFRPGMGRWNDGRRGRHDRFGRPGRNGHHRYGAYEGFGIAGPIGEVDPHGSGFFAGGGGAVRVRGGRPYYDYDRAYPYEWASAAGGPGPDRAEEERWSEARPRCTYESGVRVCRGW
ncbi:MAG TPA: hypothetical protein VF782_01425 [Allosphingosinicella sp.]